MRSNIYWAAVIGIVAMCANAPAQSYPPAFSAASSYAVGDQVQLNGNVLRCTHAVTPGGFKYDDWEMLLVRSNTVLEVGIGQTFSTLQLAWQYAENATIAEGAYLHIYVSTAKGNHSETLAKQFSLDHPFGAQISVIGDNAGNIDFDFSQSNGFVIDSGHSLAALSGISITANIGIGSYDGLVASSNAALTSVASVTFNGNFQTYVEATSGAVVNFLGTDKFNGNESTLISADGGTIYIPSNTSLNGGVLSNYAIYAVNGARVFVGSGSSVINCSNANIYADFGSLVNVNGCTLHGGSEGGFDVQATHGSSVLAVGDGTPNTSVDSSSNVFSS